MAIPQTASGTSRDKENKSYVDSPSRGSNFSAQEVYIGNSSSSPFPVFVVIGDIKTLFSSSVTIPDTDVTVISYTITEPKLRINKINLSCSIEGKMTFLVNSLPVATSRTAAGKPDAQIEYSPYIELSAGDMIEVNFKARQNSASSEVESYINASELIP